MLSSLVLVLAAIALIVAIVVGVALLVRGDI